MLHTAMLAPSVMAPALPRMIAAVEAALGSPAAIAAAMAPFARDPGLLAGIDLTPDAVRYRRVPLHEDAGGRFAVAALVWLPGQMSPVHAHEAWCAVAFHRGLLTESFFDICTEGGGPVPRECRLRRAGETSHAAPDPCAIHRLANLGTGAAVSIHAYGLPFARFGCSLNRVYAA
ncbi:MAG TPA: cysteine dioxygenase family protein [Roseomonas sp.]|jgi:predicted metal-dependent enzyme (double-stranded beta helix superfamily)